MKSDMQTLEVLRADLDSSMNLMDEEAMDQIAGGTCKHCNKHCDAYCDVH